MKRTRAHELLLTLAHTHTLGIFRISISKWARAYNFSNNFPSRKADGGLQFQWYTPKVLIYVVIQSIQFIHLDEHTHTHITHSSGHVPFRLISKTCYKYRFNSSGKDTHCQWEPKHYCPKACEIHILYSPSRSLFSFTFSLKVQWNMWVVARSFEISCAKYWWPFCILIHQIILPRLVSSRICLACFQHFLLSNRLAR